MKTLIRAPLEQEKRESTSLAFALWCVAFFASLDPFDSPAETGLVDVILAGGKNEVIPVAVVDLMDLIRPHKATIELRLVNRTGSHSEAVLEPNVPLSRNLFELFKASGVCRDAEVRDLLSDPDVTFASLFTLAAEAGYNLYVRVLYEFGTIPSNDFSVRHPNLFRIFQYRLRRYLRG